MSAVFTEWLEGKGRKPTTWETLITALKEGEFLTVASDLEIIFGVHDCDHIVVGSEPESNVSVPRPRSRTFKCNVL